MMAGHPMATTVGTRNASEALETLIFGIDLKAGDEVIVTNQDHEANVGAWARLQDAGCVVRTWQVDPTGELRIADLAALLGPRTRVVAFTQCSNVVGSIHPVREITDMVHGAGAWAWRRCGPARMRGMATITEAHELLGKDRLWKVRHVVRPDLYPPNWRAQR